MLRSKDQDFEYKLQEHVSTCIKICTLIRTVLKFTFISNVYVISHCYYRSYSNESNQKGVSYFSIPISLSNQRIKIRWQESTNNCLQCLIIPYLSYDKFLQISNRKFQSLDFHTKHFSSNHDTNNKKIEKHRSQLSTRVLNPSRETLCALAHVC